MKEQNQERREKPPVRLQNAGHTQRKRAARIVRYVAVVVFGNAVAAAGSAFFVIPSGLVMGGTTGLGIFVQNFWKNEFAVSLVVYAANILLFAIGCVCLGKKFAYATLAGTLLYPAFMQAFTAIDTSLYGGASLAGDHLLLSAVCGALLFGLGIGLVVRVGASTGGTDIPPLIFYKYFGLPVSTGLLLLDMGIVFLQLFAAPIEMILYGVIIVLLSSYVIDKVSPIGLKRTQVKIVSRHYRAIREMMIGELNLGVTMLAAQTGYFEEEVFVLLTVISNRELVKLKNEVMAIDPEAFMTIARISEVQGRGFSSERVSLPRRQEPDSE